MHTDVAKELTACCARHLPAIIAQPESETAVRAAFSLLEDGRVRFEVRGQVGAIFKDLASTVVTYIMDDRVHVFLGAVVGFAPSTTTGYLTVTLPQFVIQPEMRRSFRIPMVEPGTIQVRMEDQGYTVYQPQLVDLSVGGMLVEFSVDSDPHLEVAAGLKVQLELDEQVATYLAEVRHARQGKYGLMFIESPDAMETMSQEESLKEILATVQKVWLEQNR